MKKYKVAFVASNGYAFAGYFDTRKEAREAAETYPGLSAKVRRNLVEMLEHHTATARGYQCKSEKPIREAYIGKFGVGFVEHYANADRPAPYNSNNFHVITYFVEA